MAEQYNFSFNIEGNFEDVLKEISESLKTVVTLMQQMAERSHQGFAQLNGVLQSMDYQLKKSTKSVRTMGTELDKTAAKAKKSASQIRGFFTSRGFGLAARLGDSSTTQSALMGASSMFTDVGRQLQTMMGGITRSLNQAVSSSVNSLAQIGPALAQSLGSAVSAAVKAAGQIVKSASTLVGDVVKAAAQSINVLIGSTLNAMSMISLGTGRLMTTVVLQGVKSATQGFVTLAASIADLSAKTFGSLVKGISTFIGPLVGAAVDAVSGIATKITASVAGVIGKSISVLTGALSKTLQGIGDLLSPVINKVTALLVGGLGVAAIKMVDDVNSEIRTAYALLDKNLQGSANDMAKFIRDLSQKSPIKQGDLGKSLYKIFSLGFTDAEEAKKILSAASKLAVASGDENAIVNITNAMLKANLVFPTSFKNWTDVAEKLFAVIERGDVKISDLAVQLPRLNVAAEAAGISFNELGAAWALLTQRTGNAEQATTLLSNAFGSLTKVGRLAVAWQRFYNIRLFEGTKATDQYARGRYRYIESLEKEISILKATTDLGEEQRLRLVKLQDDYDKVSNRLGLYIAQSGKFIGITKAIIEFQKKLKDQPNLLGTLGQATANEQAAVALGALIKGSDTYLNLLDRIEKKNDKVDKGYKLQMESINKQFDTLYNAALGASAVLVNFFREDIVNAIGVARESVISLGKTIDTWLNTGGWERFRDAVISIFNEIKTLGSTVFLPIRAAWEELTVDIKSDYSIGDAIVYGLRNVNVEAKKIFGGLALLIKGQSAEAAESFSGSIVITSVKMLWAYVKMEGIRVWDELALYMQKKLAQLAGIIGKAVSEFGGTKQMGAIATHFKLRGSENPFERMLIPANSAKVAAYGYVKDFGNWLEKFSGDLRIDVENVKGADSITKARETYKALVDELKELGEQQKKNTESHKKEIREIDEKVKALKFMESLLGGMKNAYSKFLNVNKQVWGSITGWIGQAAKMLSSYLGLSGKAKAPSVGLQQDPKTGETKLVLADSMKSGLDASQKVGKLLNSQEKALEEAKQFNVAQNKLVELIAEMARRGLSFEETKRYLDETAGKGEGTFRYATGRKFSEALSKVFKELDDLKGTGYKEALEALKKITKEAGKDFEKMHPQLAEFAKKINGLKDLSSLFGDEISKLLPGFGGLNAIIDNIRKAEAKRKGETAEGLPAAALKTAEEQRKAAQKEAEEGKTITESVVSKFNAAIETLREQLVISRDLIRTQFEKVTQWMINMREADKVHVAAMTELLAAQGSALKGVNVDLASLHETEKETMTLILGNMNDLRSKVNEMYSSWIAWRNSAKQGKAMRPRGG